MDTYKTITNIPGWADMFATSSGGSASKLFQLVPLVYRCVTLKSDSLSSVPLNLYKKGETDKPLPDWPWPDFDPVEWSWKTCAALNMKGASYSVKLITGRGQSKGLKWVNPFFINVEIDGNAKMIFKQNGAIVGGDAREWTEENMLYIRLFNPDSDYLPGIAPLDAALKDGDLIHYMTRFSSAFFEKGAMPVTILSVEKQTTDQELTRFEQVMKQALTGLRNAFRMLVLRGGKEMAPTKLTPDLKDLTMPLLETRARAAICAAFGIPQTMLEDAANFATAKEHRLSFWQDTIRPLGVKIESALNKQVLNPLGLEAHYAFDTLDIFQEDESERAGQLSQLTTAGFDLLTACEILGYELTDEQKQRIGEKKPEPEPQPIEVNQPPAPQPDPNALRSALYNWKAAALKAIKTGNPANIEFDNPAIPENVVDGIHDALESCKTADEVHAVFKEAREWLKTPQDTKSIEEELKRSNALMQQLLSLEEK